MTPGQSGHRDDERIVGEVSAGVLSAASPFTRRGCGTTGRRRPSSTASVYRSRTVPCRCASPERSRPHRPARRIGCSRSAARGAGWSSSCSEFPPSSRRVPASAKRHFWGRFAPAAPLGRQTFPQVGSTVPPGNGQVMCANRPPTAKDPPRGDGEPSPAPEMGAAMAG